MTFGSMLPADMIKITKLSCYHQSDVSDERQPMELIYESVAIMSRPLYSHMASGYFKRQVPHSCRDLRPGKKVIISYIASIIIWAIGGWLTVGSSHGPVSSLDALA